MGRAAVLFACLLLAFTWTPGSALAGGAPAKVVSSEPEKLVVRFENGEGSAFPAGMRDVEIRSGGVVVIRGRVMTSSPDEATFAIIKGKATGLPAGTAVEVEQATAAEGIDGC